MAEFRMPSLGADMDAGTLVEWKIKPGDRVKRGDIIADVETAKGIIEIEIFEDGVVDQIFVVPGTKIPVGEVMARICSEAEFAIPITPKRVVVEEKAALKEAAPVIEPTLSPTEVVKPAAAEHARISPLAKKVAADLGVELSAVVGTGPGGAIVRSDIERAAQAKKLVEKPAIPTATTAPPVEKEAKKPEVIPPVVETKPAPAAPSAEEKRPVTDFQTAMRQAIAAAMSRSNRDIPHYYLETHIDLSRALRWLDEENTKRTIKDRLLPVVMLLKAVARALVDIPELNGYWVEDHLQTSEAINIGFAISLRQGGLVTPAIHHVDLKSMDELREAINDLILRTRAGRLRSSEMTDSTITVTSFGDRGVEKVFGVIYPPQVALVGFGKVIDQPWAENGMIGIRPVLIATLAGDHRATDGHRGALFLEALNKYLQEVEKL
jgi:pyruvate dehydrogenase E2 component (dihydrolipoamide acetyltransferase)